MKKHILFLMMVLLPMMVSAQSTVKIDGIYYKLNSNDNTAEVVFHRKNNFIGDVVIPSSVTYENVDYSVTSIGNGAFRGSSDLTSVTIPNSVTSIGTAIFTGCTSLASIIIEEGNPTYDARENCNAIIETANNKLLYGCNGSTIPNSVTSIGDDAFKECTGLISVDIPNAVTSIGNNAFYGCSGLTSLTVGNGVTTIPDNVFKECSNLTKVEINNNAIVSKDYGASPYIKDIFGSHVKEYILGEDVTSIGEMAFSECPNLTTVHLSNGITSIGVSAFSLCSSLTEVNIPSSVTSLDKWSFYGCLSLTKVEINSNTIVSKDYPDFMSSLSYGYFGTQVKEYILGGEIKRIGNYAFAYSSNLTSIDIPSGVTSIGEKAFCFCSNLATVVIPNSVKTIGGNAFISCGLNDMYCYAEQLPVLGSDVFINSTANATLHVPSGCLDAYSNAEQWKDFFDIVEMDGVTGIGAVQVSDDDGAPVYNLNGQRVNTKGKGIYIKNGKKMLVR